MRVVPLQLLTWGTATAAVSSALLLSASNQGAVFCSTGYRATSGALGLDLPAEPPRAGPAANRTAGPASGIRADAASF
jgi:hypothetical protein